MGGPSGVSGWRGGAGARRGGSRHERGRAPAASRFPDGQGPGVHDKASPQPLQRSGPGDDGLGPAAGSGVWDRWGGRR